MGKKGGLPMYNRANGFLLKSQLTPKVFSTLAERYASRPGGYTRIHKFGNRPGDNAPQAILELVDNPRDLKFEMTARAVGWDLVGQQLAGTGAKTIVNAGIDVEPKLKHELSIPPKERRYGSLRDTTRWNVQKVLKFRGEGGFAELSSKARDHTVCCSFAPQCRDSMSCRTRCWPNL